MLGFPAFAQFSLVLGGQGVRASSCHLSCFASTVLNVADKANEKSELSARKTIVAHSETENIHSPLANPVLSHLLKGFKQYMDLAKKRAYGVWVMICC